VFCTGASNIVNEDAAKLEWQTTSSSGEGSGVGVSTAGGVPGPTSKFVAARPNPDGGKRGSCCPVPGGCACSRGYKRSCERESEPVRQPVLPRDPLA
jgi:hypothetical protein